MKIGKWARMLLLAAPLLTGCAGFWDAPSSSSTSYTLSNSGNISVTPGVTVGNTSTIAVTPASSFTGMVSLTYSVTSAPSGAANAATFSLSPTSLAFSSASVQTSTLTAATTSSTTPGTYQITVTGTSGNVTQTTSLCALVTATSGTCTTAAGNSSGVFFVLNQGTKQIAAFSIVSGKLTQAGNAYTFPSAPYSIAVAPSGAFLYVGTATGIYLFDIGSGGALTLPSNNTIAADVATTMQVDSTGSWLVDAFVTSSGVQMNAIPITSSGTVNLAVNVAPAILPATTVFQLAISPDNKNVFVALGSSGTEIIPFTSGNNTPFGTPLLEQTANAAGAALSVAVDPSGRLFYIGETAATSGTNTGGLRVFNYSTRAEATGSPFATGGLGPYAIVPTSYGANKGLYVYAANRTVSNSTTGNIAGFSVTTTGTTSSLTPLSPTASAGITPLGLIQDSTGNYLLVVNSGGSPDLQAYSFDSATLGKLDSVLTSATGTDPVQASSIAALP